MLEIRNTEVFGLERAIKASGNAMTIGDIDTRCDLAKMSVENGKHLNRAERLGKAPLGSAHDHFLCGIHVQFDIRYPQYWTIEAERYHNFEIITSQSKMHRLTIMGEDVSFDSMFNRYVDGEAIIRVQAYVDEYQRCLNDAEYAESTGIADPCYHYFMKAVSNLPMGFEMWMTCDITYLQLKTMYFQRVHHKLREDWGPFCRWCESLPMFIRLIGVEVKE